MAGTYVAALVMVQALTGRAPQGLPTDFEVGGRPVHIEAALGNLLQDAASLANALYGRR